MDPAKRERIRKALAARQARAPIEPTVPLTPERLRSLAQVQEGLERFRAGAGRHGSFG